MARWYRVTFAARQIDHAEAELAGRHEIFFHVSGAGHEAVAVLADHLIPADYLHCHYRDKALMLARGVSIQSFLDAAFCNADSHSAGRQMNAHMSDPAVQVLSTVGPVGNNALQAVGVAAQIADQPQRPIVVCCLGDGSSQEGEVLEAIADAWRDQLPVMFVVEDNGWSISTPTRHRTFFDSPDGAADTFHHVPIVHLPGHDPAACDSALAELVARMRRNRRPVIVRLKVERLRDHTNADDQRVYRAADEIARAEDAGDPVAHLRRTMLEAGLAEADLVALEADICDQVRQAATRARNAAEPLEASLDHRASIPGRDRFSGHAQPQTHPDNTHPENPQ